MAKCFTRHCSAAGLNFTARDAAEPGSCEGCAGADPELGEDEAWDLCAELPECRAGLRADGRDVVWAREEGPRGAGAEGGGR